MASRPQDLPPNLRRIIESRVSSALGSQSNLALESDLPPNLRRLLEARRLTQESEDPEGFLERIDRFGESVFGQVGPEDATLRESARADFQQFLGILAGAADPVIGAVQAPFEIPGLFTDVELPTDRAANYLERLRVGLLRESEEAAIRSGISPEEIADIHLFGELVGYTAPIVASLKLGRMALGIKGGTDLTLARQFHLDTVAGLIFGSTLLPEEELKQRLINTSRESAVFGVGGLVLNGAVFAARGWRQDRIVKRELQALLKEDLDRVARGERVVFDDEAGVALAELLTEEGYLAASPRAQALLEQHEFEQALVAGITDWAESGLSRGFARGVGTDFQTVNQQVQRMREQFPNLKFDVVKRENFFDIHFGLTGLNNQQKAQLAREGLFAGQLIQKGDTFYQYVRRGKGGRYVVRTVDGKTATITPENTTVMPAASEEIPLPTAGEALYQDYKNFVFEKMRKMASVSGDIPETDLIRFMRGGQIPDLEGARVFESPGAITHPSELGRFPNGRKYALEPIPLDPDAGHFDQPFGFVIRDVDGRSVGEMFGHMEVTEAGAPVAVIDDIQSILEGEGIFGLSDVFGPGNIRQLGRELVERFAEQGVQIQLIEGFRTSGAGPGRNVSIPVEALRRGGQEIDDFVQGFLQEGKQSGGLLQPEPSPDLGDAFNAWLRERELPIEAGDIEAFRQNFAQRMRSDIWDLLPKEDRDTMRRVHEEMFRLIEAEELPFEVLAGAKGFNVERSAAGEVTLRDINTGARITYANEEVANRVLREVVRTEKDPMFNYLTPGPHGGMALTNGFDPTEGIFTFETNLAPEEMKLRLPGQSVTNVRDYLDALEEVSKIPFFSEGFTKIDDALLRAQRRYEPQGLEIADIWKGIPRKRRKAIAEFWRTVEGTDITGAALNRAARNAGLNSREIRALGRARRMFDLGAEQLGLPESRFISNYYSRIRGYYEEGISQSEILRRLRDDPLIHREYQFWAEMPRTGDLPHIELDPEVVMHKYFRGLAYKLEVAPLEENFRRMINTRIRDLPQAQQQQVLRRALPETGPESFVLPPPIRSFAKEYINNVRGNPNPGFDTARTMFTRLTRGLGMEVDPRVVDELHSTYLSMQYGAGIGLRLILMNRNATQNLWMMYTRVGSRHGSQAMDAAMTLEGFKEALEAGAIRSTSASVPFHDAIFNQWFSRDIARGSGPLSNAAAAVLRQSVRLGRVTRKTAEKFLIPYGSGDQVNRSIAYHWQKLHTQELLERYQAGAINWEQFVEDGLPFFSDTIKQQFRQRFEQLGAESALQYIGKQAADEAHFIYGSASSPPWMQSFFGRLFGVFGQWPLWAKQLYVNRMANATPKQMAQFWGRTAALIGMFANMSIQTGVSMWNWLAPASFGYTGGPALQLAIDARDVIARPMDQKSAAMSRLMDDVGALALPGQLFWKEVTSALDQEDPRHAALLLTLGRPSDALNFNFDIVLDPETQGFSTPPERRLPNIEGLPPIRR